MMACVSEYEFCCDKSRSRGMAQQKANAILIVPQDQEDFRLRVIEFETPEIADRHREYLSDHDLVGWKLVERGQDT